MTSSSSPEQTGSPDGTGEKPAETGEKPADAHAGEGDQGSHGQDHQQHHREMARDFKRRFWVSIALTLPVLALAPLVQSFLGIEGLLDFPGDSYVQFLFAAAVFFYGGWPFLTGLVSELADRQPGMMTLIGMAITVAFGYSSLVVFGLEGTVFFWELATLVDIMLLGHWIEMRSVLGASRALEELVELLPATAHRLTGEGEGDTEDVEVDELQPGDRILIKPGEKVPTDGEVLKGRTSMNEAMLTGESTPVEKGEGDEVIGGAVNGESSLTVEVQKTGEDTYLSQVIEMVRTAQESRSKTQDLADRAALWLTVIAITAGLLTLTGWLVLGRRPFDFALERMVTVMVITCPHALGLAIPLVVAVSTALSAKSGLLIRDRSAFERARSLDAVIFDKTGTLTEGRFGLDEVVPLAGRDEEEVLRLAAALERQSEHPIARGIVEAAEERDLDLPSVSGFSAIPGKGAEGQVGSGEGEEAKQIKVVSPGYLEKEGIEIPGGEGRERAEELAAQGRTVVWLLVDEEPAGALALSDIIREESQEAISELKELGLQVMMLTGDAEKVAAWVASELGLDDYFAEVLPDEKAEKVVEVKQRGLRTAMTGDGVNDAPALVSADVGIAIGAGTDVAIESADIVLVQSDPRDVADLVRLSRATYGKMVQNLWWATGYNAVAIPLAAGLAAPLGIMLSPAAGAVLMSLSTVIVAVNARLLRMPG